MRIEIPYRRHRCWRIGRLLHHLFFQYTQRGVCLLVAWIPNFWDLKTFLSKREMIGTIFEEEPSLSSLRSSSFCALSLSLSRSSNHKNEPYVSKYKRRGKKTKVWFGKTHKKRRGDNTKSFFCYPPFPGMLLWLPMISRFLCFSKAYLCRGQSSPKRRWIVVASWRQLWRRPWRRRFGIVKRTLCVRVVCVCVCVL